MVIPKVCGILSFIKTLLSLPSILENSILWVLPSHQYILLFTKSRVTPLGHPMSELIITIRSEPSRFARSIFGFLTYQSDQNIQPRFGATAIALKKFNDIQKNLETISTRTKIKRIFLPGIKKSLPNQNFSKLAIQRDYFYSICTGISPIQVSSNPIDRYTIRTLNLGSDDITLRRPI